MTPIDAQATTDANDPIKHVVLLLLENRSFDQMLGDFKSIYPQLEGIDRNAPGVNSDDNGNSFAQAETREEQMPLDPRHETIHVSEQLKDNNSGFVRDFAREYPQSDLDARQQIMSFYPVLSYPERKPVFFSTRCTGWPETLRFAIIGFLPYLGQRGRIASLPFPGPLPGASTCRMASSIRTWTILSSGNIRRRF